VYSNGTWYRAKTWNGTYHHDRRQRCAAYLPHRAPRAVAHVSRGLVITRVCSRDVRTRGARRTRRLFDFSRKRRCCNALTAGAWPSLNEHSTRTNDPSSVGKRLGPTPPSVRRGCGRDPRATQSTTWRCRSCERSLLLCCSRWCSRAHSARPPGAPRCPRAERSHPRAPSSATTVVRTRERTRATRPGPGLQPRPQHL
jgi:hypothetical protein